MLKRLVGARFSSARAFVRVAYPSDQESAGSAYVSKVIAGIKPPPLDRLDDWADALSLTDLERRQFKLLAGLAHIPGSAVRELMADELAGLRAIAERQTEAIRKLNERLESLENR